LDVFWVQNVAEKKGNELATISVYLNTPIAAILLGVGFIAASLLFAGVMLIVR
tara:strand:+ start:938 stop:1096 length:159 start_codon:yes stop_codon:yes gene_type:complete